MLDLRTDDFDYTLPVELIAQEPTERRDASRLMVLHRQDRSIEHRSFADIGEYLRPGDLLVANRSRVIPARLLGKKESGGAVELLLLRELAPERWNVLARPSRRLRSGLRLSFPPAPLTGIVEERLEEGEWVVRFEAPGDVAHAIRSVGGIPLPPYIQAQHVPAERYQTVYADREGSVASPTAGLHFTPELIAELGARGIDMEFVTLHVGLGTFRPVKVEKVRAHHLHSEWGEVPTSVAERLNAARNAGGRLVAVGTTTVRLLESAAHDGTVQPFAGETDIFILPGHRFQAIDVLVTNFHLPRSTLLMLVSAFAGPELIREAYEEAVQEQYRFFSFGDAMLIV